MKNIFDMLIGNIFRPIKDSIFSFSNVFFRAPYEITRRVGQYLSKFLK